MQKNNNFRYIQMVAAEKGRKIQQHLIPINNVLKLVDMTATDIHSAVVMKLGTKYVRTYILLLRKSNSCIFIYL